MPKKSDRSLLDSSWGLLSAVSTSAARRKGKLAQAVLFHLSLKGNNPGYTGGAAAAGDMLTAYRAVVPPENLVRDDGRVVVW
jgi:hypothetical protein